MKPTKLIILAATAAFVMNASAKLPSGLESVVIKGTVLTDNGSGKVTKSKITTDDILALIDNEYETSYAKKDGGKGYQLASWGLYEEEFAVVDKDGTVVLSNASSDGESFYELYLYPYNDETWVESYKGEKYTYTVPSVELYYRSYDENDSFKVYGLMTDKVDWNTDAENYSVKNGQGSIYFDNEGIYGPIMGASVSGSGKDVDYPFDW